VIEGNGVRGDWINMSASIGQRKADHLELCAKEDVGFRGTRTLFDDVRLVHNALADLDEADLDTSTTLFGKKLSAPLVIAAMTGGTEEAGRINRELARLAEERGLAFGLGSQRAMTKRASARESYRVRDVAPTTVILGNLGLVQARDMSTDEVGALARDVGADAICLHLNPAMELIQPGGDRDFSRGLETIARLVKGLPLPVVVKETGCGLSPEVGRRLIRVGVTHVDVSGAGGTSWVGVETKRAASQGDGAARALGEALWDWGIPTAASVALMAPLGFRSLIATGGVATGVDVAKALCLGATCAGIARPLLKALVASGPTGAALALDTVMRELRAVMLLTGSHDPGALKKAPRVVLGELARWIEQLSGDEACYG
jgi:isopentenyl-diphosphate delta-isomerase